LTLSYSGSPASICSFPLQFSPAHLGLFRVFKLIFFLLTKPHPPLLPVRGIVPPDILPVLFSFGSRVRSERLYNQNCWRSPSAWTSRFIFRLILLVPGYRRDSHPAYSPETFLPQVPLPPVVSDFSLLRLSQIWRFFFWFPLGRPEESSQALGHSFFFFLFFLLDLLIGVLAFPL